MKTCMFCEKSVSESAAECPHCGAALPSDDATGSPAGRDSAQAPGDASRHEDVVALMAEKRKIEAIRLFRERTGVGLAEAKAAVEAMERNDQTARAVSTGADAAVLDLMRDGQKIAAIKLYRERTGAGLRDAKEAVERLAAQHGIAAGRAGCFGALAFGAGVTAIAWNWC
jgi:ribosomal protein L7/L12